VTISGRVIANTCTLDTSASDLQPVLPNIADKDIKGIGTTGGEKEVKIVLKECGAAASKVTVKASGIPEGGSDGNVFKNTSQTGAASGVGIYFYQNTTGSEKFDPQGNVIQDYVLKPGQDNMLKFRASYVGTQDLITAGKVETVVNLTMTYQ
jgi:major type 1 subunit fimbrin (pilin)